MALGLVLTDDLIVRAASGSGAGAGAGAITDPNPITLAIKWLQGQGHAGALAACVLLVLGVVLSQAGNLEKVAGWLGLKRKQPPAAGPDPAPSVPPCVNQSAKADGDVYQAGRDQNFYQPPPPDPKLPAGRSPSNLPADTESLVARQGELELLARELVVPGKEVVIHGMPGVGKSALALRFAAQSSALFPGGVLRLEATEEFSAMAAKAVAAVEDLFADLRLGEEDLPLERKLRRCWQRWPGEESQGVLVVVDDLPAAGPQSDTILKELREFMPKRFRRLITQRHRPLSGAAIDLGVLPDGAHGLELLSMRAGVNGAERIQREEAAGLRLVDRVGRLPLALVLLAGRLQRVPTLTLAQLEADLDEKAIEAEAFLQEDAELLACKGMVETFLSSWQALTEAGKTMARLLSLTLPGAIPWELVERSRRADQPLVEGSGWTRGLADLMGAHLLEGPTEEQGRQVVRLHPLSRDFLQRQVKQEGWAEECVWRQQLEHSARALMAEREGWSVMELVGYGRQAQALAPADGWLCFHLGYGLMRLGQLADAAHEFSQARRLGTEQGDHRLISSSWSGTGDVLLAKGDGYKALSAHQNCLVTLEALVQRDPAITDWQRDLSVGQEKVGDVLLAQGDHPGALAAYKKSLVIREALTKRDPANTQWQRDLSISYERIGDVYFEQINSPDAQRAYQMRLDIMETLAKQDPVNTDWQRELSVSQEKVGDALLAQDDHPGALAAYKKILVIREALTKRDPANTQWQRDLSISHERIGEVFFKQGDSLGAMNAYKKSLVIREALALRHPENSEWQVDVAVSFWKMSSLDSLLSVNDRRVYLQRGRQTLLKLKEAGRLPANRDWIGWFDQALDNL
jgi:tetratricopeptide (TPR) repeat protein